MKRVVLTLLILLLIPFASASLSLSQPDTLYSIGDQFDLNATIYSTAETSGFFTAKLVCDSKETEIFKTPETIKEGETKTILMNVKLDKSLLGDIVGTCSIKAEYADSKTESRSFRISDEIEVSFLINGVVSSPGEQFTIDGTATKQNSEALEGYVDIYVRNQNLSKTEPVKAGKFTASMDLPKDMTAGEYKIIATAYEKDSKGNVINSGKAEQNITIRQVPRDMDIAFNEVSLTPEDELIYTILLYDQTGMEISQETAVTIIKPDKGVLSKEIVFSDRANNLSFSSNSPPGTWQVESKLNNLSKTRTFVLGEYPKIVYKLSNNSLVIENIGNVVYTKPIVISIGDNKEIRELNLQIGEKQTLNLFAPNGEYPIKISTGQEINELGRTFLTGNTVAVKEPEEGSSIQFSFWIWVALIIILAAIAFTIYKRFARKGYLQKLNFSEPKKSDHTITSGEKNYSAVLALHIKNANELKEDNPEALELIHEEVQSIKEKSRIRQEGDYYLFVFPAKRDEETGTIMGALGCGDDLKNKLNQYNKNARIPIEFGIGMHTGSVITGKDSDNKVKFTAIGNILSIAKRIASNSKSSLLISEQVHRIAVGKVKSEHLPDKSVWSIKGIPNRGIYEKFIKGFLRRQGE